MLQLFDWAIQKGIKGVYCNACFSRIYYFYDNERTDTRIDGLMRRFEFFGGVPHEVLFGNTDPS